MLVNLRVCFRLCLFAVVCRFCLLWVLGFDFFGVF